MNSKQRLLATLRGEPIDHVPIYTHIPYVVTENGFEPGAFDAKRDCDPWRKNDPAYARLVKRMAKEGDNWYVWQPTSLNWENISLAGERVVSEPLERSKEGVRLTKTLSVKGRTLKSITGWHYGSGSSWAEEHWCKCADDARFLLDLEWQGQANDAEDFEIHEQMLGDKGLMYCNVFSPLYIVCALFDPTVFYEFVITERDLIHRLLERMQERIMGNLKVLLEAGLGPVIRFGGAERATPPLMGPKDFDDFYVGYDQPLFDLCKQHKKLIGVHCHGQVSHALTRFVEMGVDQTDPVEAPPSGDVTMRQAREIVGKAVTLAGNIQSNEIEFGLPGEIRQRVRQIIDEAGPEKLIITVTGTPLEQISPQAEANYNAMIDAVLDYGRA